MSLPSAISALNQREKGTAHTFSSWQHEDIFELKILFILDSI